MNSADSTQKAANKLAQAPQMQFVQQTQQANGNTTNKTYIIHNNNGMKINTEDKNFHQKVL